MKILSAVWSCSSEVKRIFCVGMWQWMKHVSTTTHLKQKDRQLSGQQLVKAVQNDQKLNSRLARLWHPYFGSRMVFYLSTMLIKVKQLTAIITWYCWIDWALKLRKTTSHAKEEVLFHQNNALWHKSMKTMIKLNKLSFELLNFWVEKNATGKEIWLQWRSVSRNWGLFWEQRRIILHKRHRKVREALKWMYYARRKLYWSIKSNFSIKLCWLKISCFQAYRIWFCSYFIRQITLPHSSNNFNTHSFRWYV